MFFHHDGVKRIVQSSLVLFHRSVQVFNLGLFGHKVVLKTLAVFLMLFVLVLVLVVLPFHGHVLFGTAFQLPFQVFDRCDFGIHGLLKTLIVLLLLFV